MEKGKFADIKEKLKTLPLPDRVALEIRLAKELGLAITPAELISIGTPTQVRTRIDHDSRARTTMQPNAAAYGRGSNLESRRAIARTFKAGGLTSDLEIGSVREAIKQ